MQSAPISPGRVLKWAAAVFGVLLVIVAVSVGGCAGIKAFNRSQARANANNRVAITKIEIRNQEAQAQVTRAQNAIVNAQAEQRYLAAVGVRRAQDEIARTLTPIYVQWDAIQAQLKIATAGRNNTVIYVPSGQAGVPTITAPAASGK